MEDGDVVFVVVPHDETGVGRIHGGKALDETAAIVGDLHVDARGAFVTRIGRQRALGEVPNGIVRALPGVLQSGLQSVDIGPALLEREVSEHVVEGPILEEQYDDVLDRIQAHVCLRLTRYDGSMSVVPRKRAMLACSRAPSHPGAREAPPRPSILVVP